MATPATATLSMKLLIDAKAQRVLFAEASKDVVDFLFSLLTMPVATAVKLVGKDAMVGCVANLYSSVEKHDTTYVQPVAAKDALLSPTVLSPVASATSSLLRLPAAPSSSGQLKAYFKCSSCYGNHVTDTSGASCPSCGNRMKQATLHFVAPTPSSAQQEQNVAAAGGANGFVQGIVTYTVMDDLTVTPMSAISSITLLNAFGVRDLADLQERTVQLGYNEGLAILKMSLQSKTVLTDVFLGDKNSAAAGDRA